MESHSDNENQSDPASVLASLTTDRDRIGERVTAETWWAAPAQGAAVALMIGAPAAGLEWAWLPFILSMGVFIGVELLFRKRSGFGITLPAGPGGWWLLAGLFIIILIAMASSTALTLFGLSGWAIAVAVTAGVAAALTVAAYDRTYAAEVRHAG